MTYFCLFGCLFCSCFQATGYLLMDYIRKLILLWCMCGCMWNFCLDLCFCTMSKPDMWGGQKSMLDPLPQDLPMVICNLCAGIWNQVIFKSRKHSYPLSHVSRICLKEFLVLSLILYFHFKRTYQNTNIKVNPIMIPEQNTRKKCMPMK